MTVNNDIYYISQARWDEFLSNSDYYGFVLNDRFIYPQALTRETEPGWYIRINISNPCINFWDGEDKNSQREVWLYNSEGRGWGSQSRTRDYVKDLINAGLISEYKKDEYDETVIS